jgi:hypothetical protein
MCWTKKFDSNGNCRPWGESIDLIKPINLAGLRNHASLVKKCGMSDRRSPKIGKLAVDTIRHVLSNMGFQAESEIAVEPKYGQQAGSFETGQDYHQRSAKTGH